ncbi:hypothetical protein [Pseudanabaena sp. UWO310]|uniref:hypothetical protein n=1 Tax=Pseudanabaena sp. UWO310 TaxID=2480795 RepID=UPI00115819B5|nr:hypothetical protein [Pseudanabaena sp. UWO310]TYQ30206.1 hypothetical protein PseudUWO310_09935 [Pseudanabaena sp. UWO310]
MKNYFFEQTFSSKNAHREARNDTEAYVLRYFKAIKDRDFATVRKYTGASQNLSPYICRPISDFAIKEINQTPKTYVYEIYVSEYFDISNHTWNIYVDKYDSGLYLTDKYLENMYIKDEDCGIFKDWTKP